MGQLARIKDKVVQGQQDSARSDVIVALQKFHESGQKLRKVKKEISGQINWWTMRDPNASNSVMYCGSDRTGVMLGMAQQGVVQGKISFPSHGMWNLTLTVRLAWNVSPPSSYIHLNLGIPRIEGEH